MSKIPRNIIDAFSQAAITADEAVEKIELLVRGMQVAAVEEALETAGRELKDRAAGREKAADEAEKIEMKGHYIAGMVSLLIGLESVGDLSVTAIIDAANEKLRTKVK